MPLPIFATPDFGAGACAGMILMLTASAIVAVAVFGVWWVNRAVKSPKRKAFIFLCLLIAAFPTGYYVWSYHFRPYQEFARLLAGDGSIRIEAVEFSGQGRRLALSDREGTAYLTERIRSALRDEFVGGVTYDARILLSTGRSITCAVYIPGEKGALGIRFPVESLEEGRYYKVLLPDPIPDSLSEAIAKLN